MIKYFHLNLSEASERGSSQESCHTVNELELCYARVLDNDTKQPPGNVNLFPQKMKKRASLCLLFFCLSVASIDYFHGSIPESRPSGLPTYTPPNSNFSGPAFLKWASTQTVGTDGYLQVGITPGQYDVYTSGIMLNLGSTSNTTFWLDGVELTFRVPLTDSAILSTNTENISIRGLTVHMNPPQSSQAQIYNVTKVDSNTWNIDFRVCDGYPVGFFQKNQLKYVYDGQTLLPSPRFRSTFGLNFPVLNLTSDGVHLRVVAPASWLQENEIVMGDILGCPAAKGPVFSVVLNSRNFSFIDYTITSAPNIGWWLQGGYGGHVLKRVRVMRNPTPPVPNSIPPVISLSSDAFHVVALQNGPTIVNCWVEAQRDDGVNLLSYYGRVWSYHPSDNTLLVNAPWFFAVGDVIRLYDGRLQPLGYATIAAMKVDVDKNTTFTLSGGNNSLYSSAVYASDGNHVNTNFVISNNTFLGGRAHGILCKGHRGEISHNNFSLQALGDLFIMPAMNEGDYSSDISVKFNRFQDGGIMGGSGWIGGTIYVRGDTPDGYVPTAGAFINISITDNVISGSGGSPALITSVRGLTFARNQFEGPFRSGALPLLFLQNNEDATVVDNCVWGNISGIILSNNNSSDLGPRSSRSALEIFDCTTFQALQHALMYHILFL